MTARKPHNRKRYTATGQRFGITTVVEPDARTGDGILGARLQCDCGTIFTTTYGRMFREDWPLRSCGCLGSGPPRRLQVVKGQRFGHGIVIESEVKLSRSARGARLLCDCGNEYAASLSMLLRKDGKQLLSCGCGHFRTHGLSKTHPLYQTWFKMIQRCENPNEIGYRNYGGRGIKVCDAWHDVAVFVADIEREIGPRPADVYPSGRSVYTLDRIDNDGNYEPGNVRWATSSEQKRNQRPRPRDERGRFV